MLLSDEYEVYGPRLDLLIRCVEEEWLPAEAPVDLSAWVKAVEDEPVHRGDHCGTTCCVVGHAAIDPRFNALGLYWDSGNTLMRFEGEDGWDAARAFFGLGEPYGKWGALGPTPMINAVPADEEQGLDDILSRYASEDVEDWLFSPGAYDVEEGPGVWQEVLYRLKLLRSWVAPS